MSPKASILLPSFNYAHFLPEALASVASQTLVDWELVAVDDGSSDGSLDLLRDFAVRHPGKVKVLMHPARANRGLADTLRLGLAACQASALFFLEADDVWETRHLSARLEALSADREAVAAHGSLIMIGEEKSVRRAKARYRWRGFPPAGGRAVSYDALPHLLTANVVMTLSSVAVLRSSLEGLDWEAPYDVWTDWWILSQLSLQGRFRYVAERTVRWRLHEASYNARQGRTKDDLEGLVHAYQARMRRTLIDRLTRSGLPAHAQRAHRALIEKKDRSENWVLRKIWRRLKRAVKGSVCARSSR